MSPQPSRIGSRETAEATSIAVVGSGISGLSAAWLLSQRHRVTLFEKAGRLGGHSNTVEVETGGRPVAVDTGFIVYNPVTYPNLVALFDHLHVPTKPSDMSFAVSLDNAALEYSGADLSGLFGQRTNIIRPRLWSMLGDLLRFYREAPRDLWAGRLDGITLGEYLAAGAYRRAFVEDHLLPMASAIWSSPQASIRDHDAGSFVRFFENHGLLRMRGRPVWRTVDGGAREYVRRMVDDRSRLQVRGGAHRIRRGQNGVEIADDSGAVTQFDDVVIAAHADEALQLLTDATPLEQQLLGSIRYQPNDAVLHSDASLMPRRRRVWASWNYLRERDGDDRVFVTYWMNKLQGLDARQDLFVTLNPTREPANILARFCYHHPLLDTKAVAAQRGLWQLQGARRTWFCGAYFGAGFHEDGLQSGLAVAEQLGGVRRPWRVSDESGRIALAPAHLEAAE